MEDRTYKILHSLAERGWTSLHSVGVVLNKKGPTMHSRQKGKNRIHTVRVGGINRVSEVEFLRVLETERDGQVIKQVYQQIKRQQEKSHE